MFACYLNPVWNFLQKKSTVKSLPYTPRIYPTDIWIISCFAKCNLICTTFCTSSSYCVDPTVCTSSERDMHIGCMLNIEYLILNTEYWIFDVECWIFYIEYWILCTYSEVGARRTSSRASVLPDRINRCPLCVVAVNLSFVFSIGQLIGADQL